MTRHNNQYIVRFKTVLFYNSLFWGVWLFFYAFIFYINIKLNFLISLSSSFTLTLPLFILSLLLWPIIRKMQYTRIHLSTSIVIHIVGANLYSALWLTVYYGTLFAIFGDRLYQMFDVIQTIIWQYPTGITFYLMISGGYYSLIYYREIKNREIKESQLQILLKESQLNALKNQLNPHFLFNALNAINALIPAEPEKARKMLIKVADLLRLSITKQKDSFVTLATEMEFVHTYLDIEKIRLSERLEYIEKTDDTLMEKKIPCMILQPLIENAVKHGLAPSRNKGFIELSVKENNNQIKIEIHNSIPEKMPETNGKINTGFGLKNIDKRLHNIYGSNMKFSYRKSGSEYNVRIELPFKQE